jgi:hypothetical protein
MWKSVGSISKAGGKGGKRLYRFPRFPSAGISTVCFGRRMRHAAAIESAFSQLVSNSAGLR